MYRNFVRIGAIGGNLFLKEDVNLVLEISAVNQRILLQILHLRMYFTLTYNLWAGFFQDCALIYQKRRYLQVPSFLSQSPLARDLSWVWMTSTLTVPRRPLRRPQPNWSHPCLRLHPNRRTQTPTSSVRMASWFPRSGTAATSFNSASSAATLDTRLLTVLALMSPSPV